MEFLDEIFSEDEQKLAEWDDVDKTLRMEGAPEGLTLSGKLAWVLADLKAKAAVAERKMAKIGGVA